MTAQELSEIIQKGFGNAQLKYEHYYKGAKAIIADEGGMLSHAAIFCREFKIPG